MRLSGWVVLMAALAAAGCGYSTRSSLDERYQTIAVPAFQNYSREYDLQAPLTNAIVGKFVTDGRLKVVDVEDADLLLEGVILNYGLRGLTFDADDEVSQFFVVVTAGVRLTDRRTGEILWEDREMAGEST